MTQATRSLSFTASDLATFDDCEARFFHSQQRYRDGLLPTDRTAADVSSAVHDALMELHRQVEASYRRGRLPTLATVRERVQILVERALRARRLDATVPEVAARLKLIAPGLEAVASLILADMPAWAVDEVSGEPLVWVEATLDHGAAIRAVELAQSYLVRTKPDLIGIRLCGSGQLRVLIRDYKARNQSVDPAFDTGILVRALWALAELAGPRCRWFLAGRRMQIDPDHVDLETVNLMQGGSDEFLLRASLSRAQLLAQRARLIVQMVAMDAAIASGDPDEVAASPSQFCQNWCPFLAKCVPGIDYVRKYCGVEELGQRMQLVSSN